jgi:hypothetical protein
MARTLFPQQPDDGFASLMTDELSIPGAPLHDHFLVGHR